MQLSYTKTTKIEDETKFVVVHSTNQSGEYQPFEKRTHNLLPFKNFGVTADRVKCLLGSPSILHGLVLLAKSSTSRQPYPQSGFTYSVSKGARQLILIETLVLDVSAVNLLMSKSREILT